MTNKKPINSTDKAPGMEEPLDRSGATLLDPAPREMLLRVTMACNQNCIFCNTYNLKNNMMTCRDVYIACLEMVGAGQHPIFTGGEPTLHKNLYEMVGIAQKVGVKSIGVQTNAMRFSSPEYTKAFKRVGMSYATVSLHSHDSDVSDAITNTPGSFLKTVEGIRNMAGQNILVGVNHVLNSNNYKDVETFITFLRDKVFGEINCNPSPQSWFLTLSMVQPIGKAEGAYNIVPRLSDLSPYFVSGLRRACELGISVINPGCGIPICFTPGYENYSSEYHSMLRGEHDIGTFQVKEKIKAKGKQCGLCIHNSLCLGFWRAYADMYGLEELTPVSASPDDQLIY